MGQFWNLEGGPQGYVVKRFEFADLDAFVDAALQRRSTTLAIRNVVVRSIGESAYVTRPARVVLRPQNVRRSRTNMKLRVALAATGFAAIAFMAGASI
ncbi:MAG TPA: hypothetical protein VGD49_04055 [Longimicrobiales bacterium]